METRNSTLTKTVENSIQNFIPPTAQTTFYDTLLAETGVTRMMELGDRGYAWAAAMDKPMLCIMKPYDGFYAAYFRDLDGNKLDVFSYG